MKKFLRAIIAVGVSACVFALCSCSGSPSASYDWIINTIEKYYYYDISEDVLHKSIMENGLSDILDIYSAYYTKEEYAQVMASNRGKKNGIGVSYQYLPEGVSERGSGILITEVIGSSPAYYSGLKAGEFVSSVTVGGSEIQINRSEDFTAAISAAAEGEEITLVTDHGVRQACKQDYTASYCIMSTSEKTFSFRFNGQEEMLEIQSGGISCLPEGVAYLRLDQFYGNAINEFATLMREYNAEGCTSLILDLRQDGGGYVDVMCGISGIFAQSLGKSNTTAMTAVYKDGSKDTFEIASFPDESLTFPAGGKLSVLADNGTASASEALIGVLISLGVIDYDDIYISDFTQPYLDFTNTAAKDCRTYGKGIMQSPFTNRATGEVLKLTTAKIYWPNGECIHGVGLTAEKCNTVETDWCITYGDEQLAKAVELIYGQAA